MRSRAIDRLESSHQRVEERIDRLSGDLSGMATRLDNRVDGLASRLDDAREESHRDHERMQRQLETLGDDLKGRSAMIEEQITNLTVKVGTEIGKMRSAAHTVERGRSALSTVASGEFVKRYRLLIGVIILIVTLVAGGGSELVRLVEQLGIFR